MTHQTIIPNWYLHKSGYIYGTKRINGRRYHFKQHRWVMEQHLGRTLGADEDVHHKNGNKADNRVENLEVLPHGMHTAIHNNQYAPAGSEHVNGIAHLRFNCTNCGCEAFKPRKYLRNGPKYCGVTCRNRAIRSGKNAAAWSEEH